MVFSNPTKRYYDYTRTGWRPSPANEAQMLLVGHTNYITFEHSRHYMTSTKAVRALGYSHGKTAVQYWEELTGRKQPQPPDPQGKANMAHGNYYEPEPQRLLCEAMQIRLKDEGLKLHPQHKWLGSHHDGRIVPTPMMSAWLDPKKRGFAEFKCVTKEPNLFFLRECPPWHLVQIMQEMEVFECDYCLYTRYYIPNTYNEETNHLDVDPSYTATMHVNIVHRCQAVWDAMYNGLVQFAESVIENKEPPPEKVELPLHLVEVHHVQSYEYGYE